MRIRIITDDFTSALDGTACFAEHGWETAVLVRPDSTATAAVVSFDTDSREYPPALNHDAVATAARAWRDADVLVLQFDSTLRGRVARDCLTALAASGRRKLLVAPAFPSAGRTVEEGAVRVDGVPVHETAFRHDPVLPVRESRIPALFRAHQIEMKVARDAAHARDALVVTGGETARRIIDALPVVSLRVCREIMPGVPLAEVRTAKGRFPLITKAGGFGDDAALVACIHTLTGAKP